jgi:uncharacterized protein
MRCPDARLIATTCVVAVMFMGGCASSPPTQFVTLSAEPAATPVASQPAQPVQLTALHIPAALDRPEVVRQPAPNRFDISETERWAAPLAQVMRLTLARDLASRLAESDFVPPDMPAPKDTRALVVTVLDIGVPAQGDLTLDASWTLVAKNPDRVVLMQRASLRAPMTGADATSQAAAMSHALGELAERIAQSLGGR